MKRDTYFIPTEDHTDELIVRVDGNYYLIDDNYKVKLLVKDTKSFDENDTDEQGFPLDFSDVLPPNYNYYQQKLNK